MNTRLVACTLLIVTQVSIGRTRAADRFWNVGSGLWSQASSWTPAAVPGALDFAYIDNAGGRAWVQNTNAVASTVTVNNTATLHILNQGSLTCGSDFVLGAGNLRGNLTMQSISPFIGFPGGLFVNGNMRLGVVGGQAYVTQDAGRIVVANDVRLGESNSASIVGYAQYTLSDVGSLQADRLMIGWLNDASGYLNLSGSAAVSVNHLQVGRSRYGGTVAQSGGQVNVATRVSLDSSNVLDTGRYTISGGTFTSASTDINDGATFTYNGGAVAMGDLFAFGGTIKLAPHGNKVLRARTLYMGSNAHIELANNSMLLTNDPPAIAWTYIRDGYADGAWDSPYGITSSFAAATALLGLPHKTALGCGPTSGGTLIKYTYCGDANVDGAVNLADFNTLAANFGESPRLWHQGDFNYDSVVNLADFNLLASNFGLSATGRDAQPTAQDWAALAAAVVPEPMTATSFFAILLAPAFARPTRRVRLSRPGAS